MDSVSLPQNWYFLTLRSAFWRHAGIRSEILMHFAARACIKIPSCHLRAPLCGIFAPNSGYIARYAPFIRDKSPTNCDAQLTEMNFNTRSVPA